MTLFEMPDWVPTRAAGLTMVESFAPKTGSAYARGRNHDRGPGRHTAVSRLSPHVRRRLVTERELVEAALARHPLESCEKFVQEVIWRTYFKGWLENRPAMWASYRAGLERDLAALATDRRLAKRVVAAEEGRTGIECFDAWATELIETGYVHNHARMWFASIWIFTLGLPWRVGADFFLRHLLDGDPASNTLGWRWVAGLHTRGKTYRAEAWNIAKFTGGRFQPGQRELSPVADALTEEDELPPRTPLRAPAAPDPALPTALLITEDDCMPERLGLVRSDLAAVAVLEASALRSPRSVSEGVTAFDRAALGDAADRARRAGAPEATVLTAAHPEVLADWAARLGARQIVTPYVPVGPVREHLDAALPSLARAGIRLAETRDDWDARIWPLATAGFFKVKQKIPRILEDLGLSD